MSGRVELKNMKKLIEPFGLSPKRRQEVLTLLIEIRNNKTSLDKFIEFLEDLKRKHTEDMMALDVKRKRINKRWNEKGLKCPACKSVMIPSAINTSSADQTDDNSKSVWMCINKTCQETIYSLQTIQEILNEIKRNDNGD